MTIPFRSSLIVVLASFLLAPPPAAAQPTEGWRVDFVPFYLWGATTSGDMSAGPATVPFYLDFADAKDNLAAAFTFHVEASKGRWGMLADLSFLRLSSEADFTAGTIPVSGDVDLDNTIFELGGSFLAHEPSQFGIIGGLRTYTLSPMLSVTTPGISVTPVDASQTSANAFVGFTLRPKLSQKWRLISRADIGGGDANLTWSAELGAGFMFKPWLGIAFGYKGLGIDITRDDAVVRSYDVVQYGPFFGLDFHWGR
jgi:hypothetical protein